MRFYGKGAPGAVPGERPCDLSLFLMVTGAQMLAQSADSGELPCGHCRNAASHSFTELRKRFKQFLYAVRAWINDVFGSAYNDDLFVSDRSLVRSKLACGANF